MLAMRRSGATLATIGNRYGLTRERVRQILQRARIPRRTPSTRTAKAAAARTIAVYQTVLGSYLEDGIPPTIRVILKRTGLRSESHVHAILQKLAALGLVRIVHGKPVPTDVLRVPPRCPDHQTMLVIVFTEGGQILPEPAWRCPACQAAAATTAGEATRKAPSDGAVRRRNL
jgi:SOS-response transcriptional repressor LexA